MTWHFTSPPNLAHTTPYICDGSAYIDSVHKEYHFRDATKMADITVMRIRRNEAGSTAYYMPEGEVIMVIECMDGILYLMREKDKWKRWEN